MDYGFVRLHLIVWCARLERIEHLYFRVPYPMFSVAYLFGLLVFRFSTWSLFNVILQRMPVLMETVAKSEWNLVRKHQIQPANGE